MKDLKREPRRIFCAAAPSFKVKFLKFNGNIFFPERNGEVCKADFF